MMAWPDRRVLAVALATTFTALAGCGELDPEVGPDRAGVPAFETVTPPGTDAGAGADAGPPCEIVDSDPGTPVTFLDVQTRVFGEYCNCHTTPGLTGITVGGLDLRTFETALAGGRTGGERDIVPGDACASFMVGKITGMPAFGLPMPRGRPALTEGDQQLVIDWIAEGARP